MVIELDSQYEKRKQEIEKIVKNVIEKHNIEISQTAFDNLIIHLSLCISRELNGTYIPTSESQINHLKDQIQSQHETEFECAKIFNSIVEEHYKKSFNEHELAYIALHFGTAFRQQ